MTRTCSKCNKPLRVDNSTGHCGDAAGCRARVKNLARAAVPSSSPPADAEDSVLERMGFGALAKKPASATADEAPPATPRKTKSAPASGGEWELQLLALAAALGLDGRELIETYCRTWVENTRARALGTPAEPETAEAA